MFAHVSVPYAGVVEVLQRLRARGKEAEGRARSAYDETDSGRFRRPQVLEHGCGTSPTKSPPPRQTRLQQLQHDALHVGLADLAPQVEQVALQGGDGDPCCGWRSFRFTPATRGTPATRERPWMITGSE